MVLASFASARGEEAIFELETLRVPGRPVEVTPAWFGRNRAVRHQGLIVAFIRGSPPDQARGLAFFAPDPEGRYGPEPTQILEIPGPVVAYDLVRDPGLAGDRVALLAADQIRLATPLAAGPGEAIALDPPTPLPAPTRELARLRFIDAWEGGSMQSALVPTLQGGRIVHLDGSKGPSLSFPLLADYTMEGPGPPPQDEFLVSSISWPGLARADDDGDGRLDLFALSRFSVWIFRLGPTGLPATPTRRLTLRPFTAAEELRHKATSLRIIARDLDGDGRADLVVHRTSGTLLHSHSVTAVYRNRGEGVRLEDPPWLLDESDALSSADTIDLDGDGRAELVSSRIAFGIVQVARALAMRRVEIELRVFPLGGPVGTSPRPSWTGSVSLPLDFSEGRVSALLPTAQGDWNGDGRKDLLYGLARDEIAVHLGVAGDAGPGFGPRVATQRAPAQGLTCVADLDGDGLDDLVVYDPLDEKGAVQVLWNRGALPGTAPRLQRAASGDAPAADGGSP
jgi:VCBS repeat protein